MASASERTEEEARKLFEDGVNPDFPLTAKIHNKYGPVVSDVRKPLPNGSQQIVGYQTLETKRGSSFTPVDSCTQPQLQGTLEVQKHPS